MGFSWRVGLGLALAGCGGHATTSGGSGNLNGGASLTGTWEFVGSSPSGVQESALVTLSASALTVNARSGSVEAAATGDTFFVTYQDGYSPQPFTAKRTPGPGVLGVIPLPLFGDWAVEGAPSGGCTASVQPASISGTCANTSLPPWAPRIDGHMDAVRRSVLQSQYGDLGGEWTLTTSTQASCTVRVEGTTISATCQNAGKCTGTATVLFDGDSGNGSTSSGMEFTAQRR